MGLTYGPLGTVLSELFPDRGALHRQLADLQPRRHLRRVAGAVRRDLAGEELRPAVRRLLPGDRGGVEPASGLAMTAETKDHDLR